MDYTFSLAQIFWLVGGIAAVIALIRTFRKPFDQLDDHERRLNKLEDDHKERRETDQLILRSLNAMVNHLIDGNNRAEMIDVRKDLQNNIIDHTK